MNRMLTVTNINVYYDNIHAVKDLSIEVNKGEIISLIGANGAGKTTILQTISGILRSKSGRIDFLGEEITSTRAHLIVNKGIAQVPEGRQVFKNLSVRDNLILGGYSTSNSMESQRELLEDFLLQ